MRLEPKYREETRRITNRAGDEVQKQGKKIDVNNIVAQKAGNSTCQIGEFLSQNLPNWQVLGVFGKGMLGAPPTCYGFIPGLKRQGG